MPDGAARRAAFRWGVDAEARAALWLRCKGYRVLARRWREGGGELDLVVRRGRALVFVEVKARADLAAAGLAITPAKVRRIARGVRAFLTAHPAPPDMTIRLDAVLIAPGRLPRHLVAVAELPL